MEFAFISGKGGTGKSSISAAIASLYGEVVLADCDVDAANLYLLFNPAREEELVYISGQKATIDEALCHHCGLCMEYCRFDAISLLSSKMVISETSCEGCRLCSRICPAQAITMIDNDKSRLLSGSFRYGKMVYGRLAPGEDNSGKLVSMVREKARKLAESNRIKDIIIDGPPGIGCPVISTITGVDKVVIVTEPTLSGLHDLYRTVKMIQQSGQDPVIILNKYDLNCGLASDIEAWCAEEGIEIAGKLPFDPQVVDAMVQGKSIPEWPPCHEISEGIRSIWSKLININKL